MRAKPVLATLLAVATWAGAVEARTPTTRQEAADVIRGLNPAILPRLDLFYEGDLHEQVLAGFSAGTFETQTVGGFFMITGCQQGFCPDKTTLVYEQEELVALVLTNTRCYLFPPPNDGCANQPVFTVLGKEMETLQKIAALLDENENILDLSLGDYVPEYEPASHILISLPDWE